MKIIKNNNPNKLESYISVCPHCDSVLEFNKIDLQPINSDDAIRIVIEDGHYAGTPDITDDLPEIVKIILSKHIKDYAEIGGSDHFTNCYITCPCCAEKIKMPSYDVRSYIVPWYVERDMEEVCEDDISKFVDKDGKFLMYKKHINEANKILKAKK